MSQKIKMQVSETSCPFKRRDYTWLVGLPGIAIKIQLREFIILAILLHSVNVHQSQSVNKTLKKLHNSY